MKDRLHEIIAEIGVLHKELLISNEINDLEKVNDKLSTYDDDVKEHYFGLLMQYYFQNNSLENFKELLLSGHKFDLRFEDIKESFINMKKEDSLIEFFEEQIVLLKDTVVDEYLIEMYEYYKNNQSLLLEEALYIIKKNRYICSHAYNNKELYCRDFFINEDLLESLKRDLPYLLK